MKIFYTFFVNIYSFGIFFEKVFLKKQKKLCYPSQLKMIENMNFNKQRRKYEKAWKLAFINLFSLSEQVMKKPSNIWIKIIDLKTNSLLKMAISFLQSQLFLWILFISSNYYSEHFPENLLRIISTASEWENHESEVMELIINKMK